LDISSDHFKRLLGRTNFNVLKYPANWKFCDDALYKFTVYLRTYDTNIDEHCIIILIIVTKIKDNWR